MHVTFFKWVQYFRATVNSQIDELIIQISQAVINDLRNENSILAIPGQAWKC